MTRCAWAQSERSVGYHDHEWGVPVHDDVVHFEFLVLEGAQAGLSWETILKKREHYREALDGFDPERIAGYDQATLDRLLMNPGLVRNRLKIASLPRNARAFLRVQEEHGSFDAHVWRFVDGRPRIGEWRSMHEIPARTAESDALSRDLAKRDFTFVGSTICYAFMQAVGLVNDHLVACPRRNEILALER